MNIEFEDEMSLQLALLAALQRADAVLARPDMQDSTSSTRYFITIHEIMHALIVRNPLFNQVQQPTEIPENENAD